MPYDKGGTCAFCLGISVFLPFTPICRGNLSISADQISHLNLMSCTHSHLVLKLNSNSLDKIA